MRAPSLQFTSTEVQALCSISSSAWKWYVRLSEMGRELLYCKGAIILFTLFTLQGHCVTFHRTIIKFIVTRWSQRKLG